MRISRLLPLIGIAIFLYLLLNMDIPRVLEILSGADPLIFSAAVLLTAANIMAKAFKWKLIFTSYGVDAPFSRFLRSWLVGLSLSMITPGKVGDFAKAYYLKDKSPLGKGITTVMADRIIDLLTLFILAILGLSLFAALYSASESLILITYALFAAFLILVVLLSKKGRATTILRPFYGPLVPRAYKERLRIVYNDFYGGVGPILGRKRLLLLVTAVTFLVWFGTILVVYLLALSLDAAVLALAPLTMMFISVPIITLLEALPISFSGLGTRDAALIFFFSYLAITPEAAISTSLLYLLTSYIFVFIGFALWYRSPIRMDSKG